MGQYLPPVRRVLPYVEKEGFETSVTKAAYIFQELNSHKEKKSTCVSYLIFFHYEVTFLSVLSKAEL
jgi:hypothetical protein